MKKFFSKRNICLIGLTLVLSFSQSALASKPNITKYDEYINADKNFYDLEGSKVYLEQFEGETILLVFWATWCGSCVSEMPELDNLAKDFRKLPFKIVPVSVDYQGIDVVKKYYEEAGIRHLEMYHDYKNQLFGELSIVGLPTAFLVNAKGKLKIKLKGKIKWHDDKIRAMILDEIDGNPEVPRNTYKPPSLNRNVTIPVKSEPVEDTKKEEVKTNDNKAKQPK